MKVNRIELRKREGKNTVEKKLSQKNLLNKNSVPSCHKEKVKGKKKDLSIAKGSPCESSSN